jgi:hypothetical protein
MRWATTQEKPDKRIEWQLGVAVMVRYASLLPPPVPAWALNSVHGQEARTWCFPDHPAGHYHTALQRQRQLYIDHAAPLQLQQADAAMQGQAPCWITNQLTPLRGLHPVVVWTVDPVSQLIVATGVAHVEERFQALLSGPDWFFTERRPGQGILQVIVPRFLLRK